MQSQKHKKADAIAQIYDAENSGNKEAQRVMNFYRKGQSLNKNGLSWL